MTLQSLFERAYLDLLRGVFGFAIVLAAMTMIYVAAWYAVSHLDLDVENADDHFQAPAWDELRRAVLPIEPEPSPASEAAVSTPAPIDPRVIQITDNLNAQFARNPGQETAFTDAYPRRAIESWIKERSGVPPEWQPAYMETLIVASRQIGEDLLINRIASVPDRVGTVRDALTAYGDEYGRRIAAAVDEAETANRKRDAKMEQSSQRALWLGVGGLATVLLLVIIVVLIRIEDHLSVLGDNAFGDSRFSDSRRGDRL